jgi:hypothetical protein
MGFIGSGERDFDYTRGYSARSCLTSIVIILILIFACSTTMIVVVDSGCVSKAEAWIPPYPNAQRVSESHDFLREFGMGSTQVIMTSPDNPQTIQTWYNEDRLRRGITAGAYGRYFSMQIEGDGSGGSTVYYFGYCWGL